MEVDTTPSGAHAPEQADSHAEGHAHSQIGEDPSHVLVYPDAFQQQPAAVGTIQRLTDYGGVGSRINPGLLDRHFIEWYVNQRDEDFEKNLAGEGPVKEGR